MEVRQALRIRQRLVALGLSSRASRCETIALIEERNARLADELSSYPGNFVVAAGVEAGRVGIATHGVNYEYVEENLSDDPQRPRVLRVATPFPFPERLAIEFLQGLDEVLCVEELDPVIERALIYACGRQGISCKIRGKLTGDVRSSGENSVESVGVAINAFLGRESVVPEVDDLPQLPVRPPGALRRLPASCELLRRQARHGWEKDDLLR